MYQNTQKSLNKRSRWDNPTKNKQPQNYQNQLISFQPPLPSYQPPPLPSYPPPQPLLPIYQPSDVFSLVDSGPLLKTPEQIAFDNEFKKWEDNFEAWKRSFCHHPDQTLFKQYERQFLDVREKLLEKRKAIYGQTGELISSANRLLSSIPVTNQGYNNNMNIGQNYGVNSQSYGDYSSYGRSAYNQKDDRQNNSRDRLRNDQRFRTELKSRSRERNFPRKDRIRDVKSTKKLESSRGGIKKNDKPKKPNQREIEKELKRKDVYPLIPWKRLNVEDRPKPVGKRAKKKTAKIMRVIARSKGENVPDDNKIELKSDGTENKKESFREKIEKLFKEAKTSDFPKQIPGCQKRRLQRLQEKSPASLNETEMFFLEYVKYVNDKRLEYLKHNNKTEAQSSLKND